MVHPSRFERRPSSGEFPRRDVDDPAPRRYPPFVQFLSITALSLVLAVLVGAPLYSTPKLYQAGDIAREDVKATRDFLYTDPDATEARRRTAEEAVSVVYDLAPAASQEVLDRWAPDLELLRPDVVGPDGPLLPDWVGLERDLAARWGVSVSRRQLLQLLAPGAGKLLADQLRGQLDVLYSRGVVANRRLFVGESQRGLVARDLLTREEAPIEDPAGVIDFEEAVATLEADAAEGLGVALAGRLAAVLLRPNLSRNSELTAERRSQARDAVTPVLYQVRRGEMLVREGDRVSPEQGRKLQAHREGVGQGGAWSGYLGLVLMIFATLFCLFLYGSSNVKKFRCSGRDAVFLAVLMVSMLAVERATFQLVGHLAGAIPTGLAPAFLFGIPVAAAAIVVRVVLNSETAVLFSIPYFAFVAIPFENGLVAFLMFAVGGMVGAHRAARACHRLDFLRAGLWLGLAQAGIALCAVLLEPGGSWSQALWWPAGAAAGGLLSGLVALGLVALAEWMFGYTTEMRLMELASLDHPLLRQLMLRAPGTYHHSIVTGSLVQAAAEAIGARALLATVAAYYHDVGKTSKPAYFIENKGDDRNRHDKLAPSMSSLILISHLKDGVELAEKHRLGADIVDIIGQHHGTSLIQFFYDRARQLERVEAGVVNEQDYRYPGPKPQSREAALVLLADAVEAASRTIPDPRPARIRGMVQKIIGRVFADGQLDECDLTLKDLHLIASSFSRILAGIYHQRIDYPLAAHKEKKDDGDLDPQRLSGRGTGREAAEGEGGEALRRLGL